MPGFGSLIVSEAPLDTLWMRLLPQPLRSRLAGRRLLQTLVENTAWLMADKIFRLGSGLFVGAWVARYLEPSGFGTLNYAQALIGLVAALSTMGLPDINVRDFVQHVDRAREIAATSIVLRCVGALVSVLVAVAMVVIARPGDGQVLAMTLIVGASLLPQALDVVDQFYQAQNEVRPIVVRRNVAYVLTSALKIAAIVAHAPLIAFAAIYAAEFLFVAIALIAYSRRDHLIDLSQASLREAHRLMSASWPLLVRQFAIGIYMRLDQVMLGRLIGDHAVGTYAAAARISEIWYFIPVAIMTAVVPRLAAKHAESEAYYQAALRKVMRAVAALSVGTALVMSFGSKQIIGLIYGPAYAAAAPVLAAHAWGGLFVGVGVASGAWFINTRNTRFGLYQAIVGAAVSFGLNLILIPRFGVVGAAWTSVAAQFVSAFAFNACFATTRPIFRIQVEAFNVLRWRW